VRQDNCGNLQRHTEDLSHFWLGAKELFRLSACHGILGWPGRVPLSANCLPGPIGESLARKIYGARNLDLSTMVFGAPVLSSSSEISVLRGILGSYLRILVIQWETRKYDFPLQPVETTAMLEAEIRELNFK